MSNFVHALAEKFKNHFKRLPVGRRAAKAFPTPFQSWWGYLPAYLRFYIIVPVVLYAIWYGLQPATVIMPFHLRPENKEEPRAAEMSCGSFEGSYCIQLPDRWRAGHCPSTHQAAKKILCREAPWKPS